jgi:predicted dehydrogenase
VSRVNRCNRRRFLSLAAAAGAASAAGFPLPAYCQDAASHDKLRVAVIGVAGRGAGNLQGVSGEQIVALCDADEERLAAAATKFPKAKKYFDFRKLLAEMDKQIDAVVVSTPDHNHAPASVMAMRMGKHCYCEKPLTHNVFEARTAIDVARQKKLATQMGTQIHATDNYRRVVELVQAGAIGPVNEVHVWCGKGWGGGTRPTEQPPVPERLHWDVWLGPAPYRPYHPCYLPAQWRRWWDFGNGTLGDMACHYMDLPFWALGLQYPTTIEAAGPPVDPETCPTKLTVHYDFPARGEQPPVNFTWYDGGYSPPILATLDLTPPATAAEDKKGLKPKKGASWGSGVLFVGSQGMLLADYTRRVLLPTAKFADFTPPEPTIPKSVGHHQEWIDACKTGSPTTCNFAYSGMLAEAVLLGNVAYRTGKKLHWDAAAMKAVNCPEADRYLRREYRTGWTL